MCVACSWVTRHKTIDVVVAASIAAAAEAAAQSTEAVAAVLGPALVAELQGLCVVEMGVEDEAIGGQQQSGPGTTRFLALRRGTGVGPRTRGGAGADAGAPSGALAPGESSLPTDWSSYKTSAIFAVQGECWVDEHHRTQHSTLSGA